MPRIDRTDSARRHYFSRGRAQLPASPQPSPVSPADSPQIYLPGQLDALLFGITEASVLTVFEGFTANIAGNWFFIAGMTFVFLPVVWYVTDRIIEPRLGAFDPSLAAGNGRRRRQQPRTYRSER